MHRKFDIHNMRIYISSADIFYRIFLTIVTSKGVVLCLCIMHEEHYVYYSHVSLLCHRLTICFICDVLQRSHTHTHTHTHRDHNHM